MSTLLMAAMATLVFCAPGYPGGAGDAQPFIDQFAKAAVTAAAWPDGSLAAVYDPSEQSGLSKLGGPDAVLAFVPFAFFVQHAAELHLTPLAQADVVGVGPQERWSLVAKAGAVNGPPLTAEYTILSVAGYAPEFIRHSALPAWSLPPDVRIESTGQLLSALRRVAAGEHVVALLDQTQAAALPTLPFAAELKVVAQSPPLPVAIIAIVDSRVSAARAKSLQAALLKMGHAAAGADTLGPLRLQGFVMPQIPRPAPAP
jgi:hypothetical protein